MERELDKFMENITLDKEISVYEDKEGNLFNVNTVKLLTSVEVLKLPKEEYTKAVFEKRIDDLEYEETTIHVPVPKNTITKNDNDKYTLVDKEMKAKLVYNVSNQIGLHKSYVNKDEALSLAKVINAKVKEYL